MIIIVVIIIIISIIIFFLLFKFGDLGVYETTHIQTPCSAKRELTCSLIQLVRLY